MTLILEVTLLGRVRAVAGYRVTVGRVVTVETLRVTEFGVRARRVAGCAVTGRDESGV